MATVETPSYRERLAYHAGLLGGVCFLVSILLLIGNLETSTPIAEHIQNDKLAMMTQVLPASLYDNQPLQNTETVAGPDFFTAPVQISRATKNGQYSGATLQSSFPGWGGDIQFIMAVNAGGEVTGVRIINHKETPGLADKIEIEKDPWITGFNGKSLTNTSESQWAVKKDQGEFDQFTGATITPRAVVKGVHQSLLVIDRWRHQEPANPGEGATP